LNAKSRGTKSVRKFYHSIENKNPRRMVFWSKLVEHF
jgi:hypothetical protein